MILIKLSGNIVEINQLSSSDTQRMYALMEMHYDNILLDSFLKDLSEKSWAVIMKDENNEIQGFSTIKLLEFPIDDIIVRGIFSGDTIIHKDFWGEREFPKVWINFVLSIAEKYPSGPFYWFLICKGYKTYRFLPVYFNSFYPSYNKSIPPFEKKVMDSFGKYKFGNNYNSETGLITFGGTKDWLKEGIADINENRLKDPHIQFFSQNNPGYKQGDEMVFIADLHYENINKIAKRFLLQGYKG